MARRKGNSGKKVRIDLRRNRGGPSRKKDWTQGFHGSEEETLDAPADEQVRGKGDLSRRRTVIVDEEGKRVLKDCVPGTVVAMRGLYADVDDGEHVWPCTVRRLLRTRLIGERHAVTVGDRVLFRIISDEQGVVKEGVIEHVEPRTGVLQRKAGRRIQTIAANVDQVIIVSSAADPPPKPHLIDRYIVAALAGNMTPILCMNKIDLDRAPAAEGGTVATGRTILDRYARLGYAAMCTSVVQSVGIEELRNVLRDKSSVIAGQSGVGKSSLLNAVQPGLNLAVGEIIVNLGKGRHTTVTARMLKLEFGGYVVDTPGIRTLDISPIEPEVIEQYFIEFLPFIPNCKFPDCTHTHETNCAVKAAVHDGHIHPDRYESYVRMYEEPGAA